MISYNTNLLKFFIKNIIPKDFAKKKKKIVLKIQGKTNPLYLDDNEEDRNLLTKQHEDFKLILYLAFLMLYVIPIIVTKLI